MAPRPNSDVAVLGPLGRLPACTCGGATAAGPTAVPAVDPAADPANVPDDGDDDDDIRVVVTAAASTAAARTRDAGGTRFKRFVRRIRDGLCELRHSKLAAPAVPSRRSGGGPSVTSTLGPRRVPLEARHLAVQVLASFLRLLLIFCLMQIDGSSRKISCMVAE